MPSSVPLTPAVAKTPTLTSGAGSAKTLTAAVVNTGLRCSETLPCSNALPCNDGVSLTAA